MLARGSPSPFPSAAVRAVAPATSASASGAQVNGGGGVMFRMSPRVNLDVGATYGLINFGDVVVSVPGFGETTIDGSSGNGSNLVVRIGVAILGAGASLAFTMPGCESPPPEAREVQPAIVRDVPAIFRGTIGAEATLNGIEPVLVSGYGLVVGLNGTGDRLQNNAFTEQSMIGFLERQGVNTRGLQLKSKNQLRKKTAPVPLSPQPSSTWSLLEIKSSALGPWEMVLAALSATVSRSIIGRL